MATCRMIGPKPAKFASLRYLDSFLSRDTHASRLHWIESRVEASRNVDTKCLIAKSSETLFGNLKYMRDKTSVVGAAYKETDIALT